jgi:hypothetical protein
MIGDPQVSLADRVKMALKALPRLHRKPKAGQSGNAIAGSRAATVQSFGTPKDAAGGGTGKDAAATKRDPIGGAGKKAGARQRCPLRFDLAVQRGALWALSIPRRRPLNQG